MSAELAIYSAPIPDRLNYCAALAKASLLPDAYRNQPANVLLALEYGAAVGIAPMTAIQGVHVIKGKPTASAQLIGALVRKAGHRLRVSGDADTATCEIIRADDPDFTFTATWTIDRARTAGLLGNDSWKKYPAAMLKARAITEAARDACPEALAGIQYTAEEIGDDDRDAHAITVQRTTVADAGEWETTEVVEAEVVEAPAGAVQPEAIASVSGAAPVMAAGVDGLLAQVKVAADALGAKNRKDSLALCRFLTQRPLGSANDLSADEARVIIALRMQVDALDEKGREAALLKLWADVDAMTVVPGVTPDQAATFADQWAEGQAAAGVTS